MGFIMHEIPQWTEGLFDEAYWAPVQELPEQETRDRIPQWSSRQDRYRLCCQAATNIFRGEHGELFSGDAVLDYSPENQFIQPGNVLLVDTEFLKPDNKKHAKAQAQDKQPAWRSPYMETPTDFVATPPTLFRKNSRMGRLPLIGETCPIVYPYSKRLYHPSSGLSYFRRVGLVLVGYDQDGEVAEPERQWMWPSQYRHDRVAGECLPRDILTSTRFSLPGSVGETYAQPDREDTLLRVKSVELCLSGTLEYAKAKKRSFHLPRFTGRIATAPQPT